MRRNGSLRAGGRPAWAAALLATASLAACAAYRPEPLQGEADRIFAMPDLRIAGPGGTEPVDLSKPLTPDVLGLIAVSANPDLKAARAQAGVARAQLLAAGLMPDPTVNLSYDWRLSGPDPFDGMAAQVAYELTALRDRGLALKGARAEAEQVRWDIVWREAQTAGQARLLGARVAALEAAAPLFAEARRAADEALARTLAAAARGDAKGDDVTARRLAAADADDRAHQNERDLDAARGDLDALLGLPPGTRLILAPPAPTGVDPAALDAAALFARARASRLDLKALEAGYQAQEVAVRKAIWDAFPTLQLTVNRAQDTANNQTLGPAVSFTLPVWNRNQGGIALARATRAQLSAEYAARLAATRAQIADLAGALRIDLKRRDELAAQAGPVSGVALAARAAAARGDLSRQTARAAEQTALDRRLALLALDQSIAEQTIALELAVGGPLRPPASGAAR